MPILPAFNMSLFSFFRQKKGSAMMEVMVSFFILTLGLTGSLSVIVAAGRANQSHKNRLIATNLAQEALEAVRNMRDTNWLSYSSDLRECWNFWEDTNENGIIDVGDDSCTANAFGQNDHPLGKSTEVGFEQPQVFLVDFDPSTFRWTLVPENRFDGPGLDTSKDYSNSFHLYERTFFGRTFYTPNRENPGDTPTLFSRKVEIYYLDDEVLDPDAFKDNGDGTFDGGEFPEGEPSQDNRLLIITKVSWQERGATRELTLSTILTDFLNRTEWAS